MRRHLTLPVDPERLWEEMTDPGRAAGWLGGRIEWELVPGGRVRFVDDGGEVRSGRIDEVDAGRQLRWTWWPDGDEAAASEVTWELEPADGGAGATELTVTEERPVPAEARWGAADDRLLAAWAGGATLALR